MGRAWGDRMTLAKIARGFKRLWYEDGTAGGMVPAVKVVEGVSALDLSMGRVPGVSCVQKFGQNASVQTSGTGEDIWSAGGNYTGWIQVALAVRIKAGGDAADDAGGAGAQSVTIEGLDENWALASETVVTNGTSVSLPTTTKFIRVFRAYAAAAGTYGTGVGSNVGTIVIENTTPVVMAQIEAVAGQTEQAIYSVKASCTAYMSALHIYVGAATKTSTVSLYKRLNGDDIVTPFGATRIVQRFSAIAGYTPITFDCMPSFPAMTDIWVRGVSQTQANAVSATFDLYLVDD